MKNTKTAKPDIALILNDIQHDITDIKKDVSDVKGQLKSEYVRMEYLELRLQPLEQSKKIVFYFITLILVAFAGALINFFIQKP